MRYAPARYFQKLCMHTPAVSLEYMLHSSPAMQVQ